MSNSRCPHCDSVLTVKERSGRVCPVCRKSLKSSASEKRLSNASDAKENLPKSQPSPDAPPKSLTPDPDDTPNSNSGISWTVALMILSHLVGAGLLVYQIYNVRNAPREEWEDLAQKMFEYRYGQVAFLYRASFEQQKDARLDELQENLQKYYMPRMLLVGAPCVLIWYLMLSRRGFSLAVLLGLILVVQAALACYFNMNTWDGNPLATRVLQFEIYGLAAYLAGFLFLLVSRALQSD